MSKPENKAAYLTGAKVRPLAVRSAPYPVPKPGQIVIHNGAIALNPLESIKQDLGNIMYGHIRYPFVLGADVAGTVVEVGASVTRFRPGDRVLAYATGMEPRHNDSAMGGYQLYTAVSERMASAIPDALAFENAAVLPLTLSTAACALFGKDQLGLRYPGTAESGRAAGKDREVVVVWGGSSSVGVNAIQLAVAAGYEVFTTCSPRNFGLVKSLGASEAFDYRDASAVAEILRLCKGRTVAGALSIGDGAAEACADILAKSEGNRAIAVVSYPAPADPNAGMAPRVWAFASFFARMAVKKWTIGVRSKLVSGGDSEDTELSKVIFEDFLPEALAKGAYVCAPEPDIIGHDLDAIQSGLDRLKQGTVSAKKLVVKF